MGTRDRYSFKLCCIACGAEGSAYWSEWDRPTAYSGTGRRLDEVSDGFVEGPPKKAGGDPTILCSKCGIEAN